MSIFILLFNLVIGLVNVFAFDVLGNHIVGCFNLLGAGMLSGVMAMEWVSRP